MEYVYILRCKDQTLYTGWTNNWQKRLLTHQNGKGAKYTSGRRPVELVYLHCYESRKEAKSQEYAIKQLTRAKKEKLITSKSNLLDILKNKQHNIIKEGFKMSKLKFYICPTCGNVIIKLTDSKVPVVCCGAPMKELVAGTVDAAVEKHVPVVTRNAGNEITVTVGTVHHPMTPEHFIEWVVLETETGYRVEHLQPGTEPIVKFFETEKVIGVYAYCNLHGLWKSVI